MLNLIIILLGKILSRLFRSLNLGDGSTWPGHIALGINKKFIRQVLHNSKTKTIIIAGTNGKTTTAAMIKSALKQNGKKSFQNKSGANLLNGIASSIIMHSDLSGRINHNFAIFETDENALPQVLKECKPDFLILLNLFRDQLDRYGEVNIVAGKWKDSIDKLTDKTTLILNADDPQIAYFAKSVNPDSDRGSIDSRFRGNDKKNIPQILFFGLNESSVSNKTAQQAADSNYCPRCGKRLSYHRLIFSHLGDWYCKNCNLKRPKLDIHNFSIYPLPGIYNKYNTLAATLVLKKVDLSDKEIEVSFRNFKPAFGRQEIIRYKEKNVQIFLSKNPTSFNQSFQAISDLGAQTLLIILNDRIPDGRDISWIWDVDLPHINNFKQIIISGDRTYDMALRLKYELEIADYESKVFVFEDLEQAINNGIDYLDGDQTLYILPTYSAMLESRKILTGKKIL